MLVPLNVLSCCTILVLLLYVELHMSLHCYSQTVQLRFPVGLLEEDHYNAQ